MQLLWPSALWLTLLLPLGVVWYVRALRKKQRAVVIYSSLALIKPALTKTRLWRRHVPPVLLALAFALTLFAASRPVARVSLPADYTTLILAMDVSRSMLAEDVPPSRIKAAQEAAKGFVAELPDNIRVGIVSFAANAQVVQAVTQNKDQLRDAIDGFKLQRGTATGSGLLVALNTLMPEAKINLEAVIYGAEFSGFGAGWDAAGGAAGGARSLDQKPGTSKPDTSKVQPAGSYTGGAIVLLSDGRRTTGADPIEAAKLAASKGARVYTVAFGTPHGVIPGQAYSSFYTQVDEESLQQIAKITEAEFFRATNAQDLKKIYAHLSSKFVLEQRETEVSALFIALALVLIGCSWALSRYWNRAVN
jgi:Ca-activated chloride channel homolog